MYCWRAVLLSFGGRDSGNCDSFGSCDAESGACVPSLSLTLFRLLLK
jgi:hypothetical protein